MEPTVDSKNDDIKTALGTLLLSADQHQLAKTVICAFDPFASRSSNIKSLSKFKLELLEPCAEFLNIVLTDTDSNRLYTKTSLVLRIILAIEALLPASCQQCLDSYCIELAQTDMQSPENPPPFVCHMCYQGSHDCDAMKQCKEALDSITMTIGHTWLCNKCHPKSIPVSQRKSRSRHVSISEHPSRAESHSPLANSQSHDHDINQADLQQRLNSVAKSRVCDKYMLGKCPHGLRGKKEVNGEICSFSHPKKCFKYCGFGNGKKGCTIGENCEYFHPQLCKFSVKKRACYNANCTFVHLKGTSRTKQPTNNSREQNPRSASSIGAPRGRQNSQSHQNQENLQDGSVNTRSSQPFLELKELVEQMRTSFIAEISSIKASLAQPAHHYHPQTPMNPAPSFLPLGHPKLNFHSPQTYIPQSSF